MGYYNYHAQAKRLIAEGHLVKMEIVERWNAISPALVLFFDNHRPMPIRAYRWDEYLKFKILPESEKGRCARDCGDEFIKSIVLDGINENI